MLSVLLTLADCSSLAVCSSGCCMLSVLCLTGHLRPVFVGDLTRTVRATLMPRHQFPWLGWDPDSENDSRLSRLETDQFLLLVLVLLSLQTMLTCDLLCSCVINTLYTHSKLENVEQQECSRLGVTAQSYIAQTICLCTAAVRRTGPSSWWSLIQRQITQTTTAEIICVVSSRLDSRVLHWAFRLLHFMVFYCLFITCLLYSGLKLFHLCYCVFWRLVFASLKFYRIWP